MIFTIQIITVGGQTTQAIFARNDLKTAYAAHYQTMASALADPNCEEALSMVINSDGGVYKSEHWKLAEEPEEAPPPADIPEEPEVEE